VNSNQTNCIIQAHPPSKPKFALSYNKIDWHYLEGDQFEYTTCGQGYTAPDYRAQCKQCPPGTYKPSSGLYECIDCDVDTYSEFSGSVLCDKCSRNTTNDKKGSSSHQDCVCDVGYYLNPIFDQHSNSDEKCIRCPSGGICNELNTTIPKAMVGFWNSKTDYHNFYNCIPSISCGGGAAENCSNILSLLMN
jgi:hypothetical protein